MPDSTASSTSGPAQSSPLRGLTGRAVLEALAKVLDDQRALEEQLVRLELEVSKRDHALEALTDQLRQSGEECDRLRAALARVPQS